MKKNPVGKRAEAERAAEWYAHVYKRCVRTVRSIRTQWQRQDMFSCDVLGKRRDGSLVALQVTSGSTKMVWQRKKKIEKEYWHKSDTIQILQLTKIERKWIFEVYEYVHNPRKSCWRKLKPVPVPREWFKKWRQE